MKYFGFKVPAGVNVSNEFGTSKSTEELTYFAAGLEDNDLIEAINRFVGMKFGSYETSSLPQKEEYQQDALALANELMLTQRLLGSIKVKSAVEARDDKGFRWIYVIATEGSKERVYFEEVEYGEDGTPQVDTHHHLTIAYDLISQF